MVVTVVSRLRRARDQDNEQKVGAQATLNVCYLTTAASTLELDSGRINPQLVIIRDPNDGNHRRLRLIQNFLVTSPVSLGRPNVIANVVMEEQARALAHLSSPLMRRISHELANREMHLAANLLIIARSATSRHLRGSSQSLHYSEHFQTFSSHPLATLLGHHVTASTAVSYSHEQGFDPPFYLLSGQSQTIEI